MYPQYLTHIISHEAPTISLLPDALDLNEWTYRTLALYKEKGSVAAWESFGGMLTGYEYLSPGEDPSLEDMTNFWQYEFIVFNNWWYDSRYLLRDPKPSTDRFLLQPGPTTHTDKWRFDCSRRWIGE